MLRNVSLCMDVVVEPERWVRLCCAVLCALCSVLCALCFSVSQIRDAFEAMKSTLLTSGLSHSETLQTLLQV